MKSVGIVLKVKNQVIILLDQSLGKILINISKEKKMFYPGVILGYFLENNNNSFSFEDESVCFLSSSAGYCKKRLSWLHELLELANKYLLINDVCNKSFIIIYQSIILITDKVSYSRVEVLHVSSVISFIKTLGYVKDFFIEEFVELFQYCCKILEEDVMVSPELDLKIKKLQPTLIRVRDFINCFKKEV